MQAQLQYIDARGDLYRGYGRQWPIVVWIPERALWVKCELPTPKDWDWGQLVTRREAERCYPNATTAPLPDGIPEALEDLEVAEMCRYRPEIFDFYDFGTCLRQSPEEIAEYSAKIESTLSEPVKALIRERKEQLRRERGKS